MVVRKSLISKCVNRWKLVNYNPAKMCIMHLMWIDGLLQLCVAQFHVLSLRSGLESILIFFHHKNKKTFTIFHRETFMKTKFKSWQKSKLSSTICFNRFHAAVTAHSLGISAPPGLFSANHCQAADFSCALAVDRRTALVASASAIPTVGRLNSCANNE